MSKNSNKKVAQVVPLFSDRSLVVRSQVPVVKEYTEYRPYLREDFFWSCAYCTMSEAEAQAIRFTIDHYEPKSSRPDLEIEYTNLMYACDECNRRKGNLTPSPAARANDFRFFRADQDVRRDHFEANGVRVEPKSNVGDFSITALDLNRQMLRRLRELRQRLTNCEAHVTEGIIALRNFHIDQLPPEIKGKASKAISDVSATADGITERIDAILRENAKSSLIDHDPNAEQERLEKQMKMNSFQALHPGAWRKSKARKGK